MLFRRNEFDFVTKFTRNDFNQFRIEPLIQVHEITHAHTRLDDVGCPNVHQTCQIGDRNELRDLQFAAVFGLLAHFFFFAELFTFITSNFLTFIFATNVEARHRFLDFGFDLRLRYLIGLRDLWPRVVRSIALVALTATTIVISLEALAIAARAIAAATALLAALTATRAIALITTLTTALLTLALTLTAARTIATALLTLALTAARAIATALTLALTAAAAITTALTLATALLSRTCTARRTYDGFA